MARQKPASVRSSDDDRAGAKLLAGSRRSVSRTFPRLSRSPTRYLPLALLAVLLAVLLDQGRASLAGDPRSRRAGHARRPARLIRASARRRRARRRRVRESARAARQLPDRCPGAATSSRPPHDATDRTGSVRQSESSTSDPIRPPATSRDTRRAYERPQSAQNRAMRCRVDHSIL